MARKLVFEKPQKVAYEDLELGPPGPGQVLARTVISGISHGTEMAGFLGTSPFVEKTLAGRTFAPKQTDDPPFYPFRHAGYDNVAVVEHVGDNVAGLQVGDRVWSACNHQTEVLLSRGAVEMARLGDGISNEVAIFINLASVALTAVNDAEVKIGNVVAVIGGGLVGQLAVQLAFVAGARRVFLSEPLAERRELARANSPVETFDPGAAVPAAAFREANASRSPDAIIECSGHIAGLHSAIQAAGVGGTVVAAGFYAGPASDLALGEEFLHNRITVKASMSVWGCPARFPFWDRPRIVRETVHLMEAGRLRFDGFLTDRVPFNQAQKAYDMIRDEPAKHLKVALTY